MRRTTSVYVFQTTNWGNLIREDLDKATEGKSREKLFKYQHKNAITTNYIKVKSYITHRIANLGYAGTKTKRLIT